MPTFGNRGFQRIFVVQVTILVEVLVIVIVDMAIVGIQLEFQILGKPNLIADFASLVFGAVAGVHKSPHFGGSSLCDLFALHLRQGGFLGYNHNGHKRSFF